MLDIGRWWLHSGGPATVLVEKKQHYQPVMAMTGIARMINNPKVISFLLVTGSDTSL